MPELEVMVERRDESGGGWLFLSSVHWKGSNIVVQSSHGNGISLPILADGIANSPSFLFVSIGINFDCSAK